MATNNILQGDIVRLAEEGHFDVIVHGCNCFCRMGAGLARQIVTKYPIALTTDKETTKADITKLGTYTSVNVGAFTIVNAYTQYRYGYIGKHVDYHAIQDVFELIKKDFTGLRIGYPRIGAGLAGGNWRIISEIINEALEGENHTLVEYTKMNR